MNIPTIKNLDIAFTAILRSLERLQKEGDSGQLEDFIKVLVDAFYSGRKIFVYGLGRSLLVGKAFSMRLMHLGFKSYVVGESTTPAVNADDVFLVVSKTLSNELVPTAIRMAKKLKSRTIMITSAENNFTLKEADNLVVIPRFAFPPDEALEVYAPLGTLFEVSVMVLLDCVVAELMHRLGITEKGMETRHANI